MAFSGFKKQLNKANQYMSEKIGGAEGTKLDDEFTEMEKRTDLTNELVEDIQAKTREYLQPNPTARAKMAAVKGISKLSGQAKQSTYPQPEGVLGDSMTVFGRKLPEDNLFGQSLYETGEALKQIADVKYSLDDNVKQNFLDPLHQLQTKDLKEVMFHRKKLQGRRLDFDCKKRKITKGTGANITEDEIRLAEDKFNESLHLAHLGMFNLIENEVEQVVQLSAFAESLLDYHRQCTDIMKNLVVTLRDKKMEAANRPKREYQPKAQLQLQSQRGFNTSDGSGSFTRNNNNYNGSISGPPPPYQASPPLKHQPSPTELIGFVSPSPPLNQGRQPSCKALYDFEPENPGELLFKEGDIIKLLSRIDENWYEGSVNNRSGYFPQSYVTIIVPLP